MKRFITTAPRQEVFYKTIGRGQYAVDENGNKLRSDGYYLPVNCAHLRYDEPCCYPVIPMINAFAEEGDEIEVIVLSAPLEKCRENIELLTGDVDAICTPRNIKYRMTPFDIPLDETIETHLAAFERIISLLSEGDILYLDMTYGSKPSMYMQLLTLNYAHQAMRNVYVECVAYGEMVWDKDGKPLGKRIFDCTKLFLMDQIVCDLGKQKAENPSKLISSILQFDPDEEV